MKILLGSPKTNGLQAIFEDIVAPGFSLGRHIHHHQDETFLFLEGTFNVEVDGKLYRMTAGDVARGTWTVQPVEGGSRVTLNGGGVC